MKKRLLITAAVLVLLLAVVYGIWALTMNPYRGVPDTYSATLELDEVLTQKQAAEDLRQVRRWLKTRHPAWLLDQQLAAQVEEALEEAERNLPERVTVLQLWQDIGRCLHLLGDAHTRVWASPKHPLYLSDLAPLQIYGPPSAIQGVAAEQFVQSALPLLSYEIEAYARQTLLTEYLVSGHWMNYLGVDTADGLALTFQTETGPETLAFGYVFPELVKGSEEEPWVSYEIDEENDLGIFRLTYCTVDHTYMETLDSFFQAVFDSGVSRIAVDLRGNGGGNSGAANMFIQYLDVQTYRSWDSDVRYGWYLVKNRDTIIKNARKPRTFQGTVYVLTDVETFSAGKDFALLLADNDLAVHVGQAPGNLPDCYIDLLQFQLPNSGLRVDVSWKRAYRIDESKRGLPLVPDVTTDTPLEWIKTQHEKNESLSKSCFDKLLFRYRYRSSSRRTVHPSRTSCQVASKSPVYQGSVTSLR